MNRFVTLTGKILTLFIFLFVGFASPISRNLLNIESINNQFSSVSAQTENDTNNVPSTETEEKEENLTEQIPNLNYQIPVRVEVNGIQTEGISVNLTGNGQNKTLVSSVGTDSFTGLKAGTYTISINLDDQSDYEFAPGSAASKQVTLTQTNISETVSFSLILKEPEVDENIENIRSIQLPATLTKPNSQTTNFATIQEDKLSEVTQFTFDNPNVNKIVYTQSLDLSNYSDFNAISLLENYLNLETIGRVRFDTSLMNVFDKSAQITMYQINLAENVELAELNILRNNEKFEPTNINYDSSESELTFGVDGFSEYEIAPTISVGQPGENFEINEDEDSENSYSAIADEIEFKLNLDWLDTNLTIFNNGKLISYPETTTTGEFSGMINLEPGENSLRILAEGVNGVESELFVTINYDTDNTDENDVSSIFTIAIFGTLIVAGLAIGGFYIYLKYRSKRQKSLSQETESDNEQDQPGNQSNSLDSKETDTNKISKKATSQKLTEKNGIIDKIEMESETNN